MMVIVPSKKVGIVILTNGLGTGGPDALAKSLAVKLLVADGGDAVTPAAFAEAAPQAARSAVGLASGSTHPIERRLYRGEPARVRRRPALAVP
jgi:hypothetical protein